MSKIRKLAKYLKRFSISIYKKHFIENFIFPKISAFLKII
jgi:hypothetical protein